MIENGEGSTSRRLWVSNEGLINLMRLKVYSSPIGNFREIHGNEFTYAAGSRGGVRIKKFSSSTISNY
jgi:hypothetical protein